MKESNVDKERSQLSGELKKCNKFYYIKQALTGGRN